MGYPHFIVGDADNILGSVVGVASGKIRAAVALAVIAALVVLLGVLATYLFDAGRTAGERKPEAPGRTLSVARLTLGPPAGSDGWLCAVVVNESIILRKCWGHRYWVEIALGNGTVLEWGGLWDAPLEFKLDNVTIAHLNNETFVVGNATAGSRRPPPAIPYSIVEVVDLLNRRAYAVEEAGTDEVYPCLERYVRVLENVTFDYMWVKLDGGLYAGWDWAPTYVGNLTFKVYLAFMDYVLDEGAGVLVYRPTPVEVAERYLRYAAETYSKLLREAGVTVVFELVDPDAVCGYPRAVVAPEGLYGGITCREYGGVNVLGVVRVPYLPNRAAGAYVPDRRLILIREGPGGFSPHAFIHELGHSLSLADLSEGLNLSVALLTLFESSVMSPRSSGTSISVGDLAILLINAYRHLSSRGGGSDAEALRARMLELGIDPESASVLLPLTRSGELPLCLRSLLGAPLLKVDPTSPEGIAINYPAIRAMTKIARAARTGCV